MPTMFSGRLACLAMSPMGSVEVLVAMMQCSGTTASIWATTLCLTESSSKTASTTRSVFAKWRVHAEMSSVRPTTLASVESCE